MAHGDFGADGDSQGIPAVDSRRLTLTVPRRLSRPLDMIYVTDLVSHEPTVLRPSACRRSQKRARPPLLLSPCRPTPSLPSRWAASGSSSYSLAGALRSTQFSTPCASPGVAHTDDLALATPLPPISGTSRACAISSARRASCSNGAFHTSQRGISVCG